MPSELHTSLLARVTRLPTDYVDYGGTVERWSDPTLAYPDCSSGCRHFSKLEGQLGYDWGVCIKQDGPRLGLLTFEHQAGFGCFEGGKKSSLAASLDEIVPVAIEGDVTSFIRAERDRLDGRNHDTKPK